MAKAARAPHKQWDEHGKRIPVRSCVVCRGRFPQAQLLRLTRDEHRLVRLDPTRRASGKGLYICANPACRTEKALMRLSRPDAARIATELEAYFTARPITQPQSTHHRIAYEEISQSVASQSQSLEARR
jgi:uncharacterized protein